MNYDVDINFVNKKSWKFSNWLITIALLFYALLWLISFPMDFIPDVLQVHYIHDILPDWVSYALIGFTTFLLLGMLFANIKHNKPAQLKIEGDNIIIESNSKTQKIDPNELLRIWIIHKKRKKNPYRIEFIYPDLRFIRVAFTEEERFFEAFNNIRNICPLELDIKESTQQSVKTTAS